MSVGYKNKIIRLAQFLSVMRGTIKREKYYIDMVTERPGAETGTRPAKQLASIGYAVATVNLRNKVTEHDYRIVRKVALDSVPQRNEDIVRILFKNGKTEDDTLLTKEISIKTGYPNSTVSRILTDMHMLKIVKNKE